jgi:uncharacterized membrane protein
MPIRLYLLLPLAITLASLHALPFLPRPDRLFGVAIPREIRYGNEGRQALRRYELQLLPWTVAAMFGSVWLPLSWAVLWIPAASLMPLTMASWIFCRRRIEVRHFAFPAPSTRQARLIDADDRLFWQVLTFVIPLAILAGTGLYLHVHWDAIPARFPIHWGTNGTPNGWSARSVAGVYGPLILGAIIVLFIWGNIGTCHVGVASKRAASRRADSSHCGRLCDSYGLLTSWTFATSHCSHTRTGGFPRRIRKFLRHCGLALPSPPRRNRSRGRRNHT